MSTKIITAKDVKGSDNPSSNNPVMTELLKKTYEIDKGLALINSASNLHANLLLVLINVIANKFNMNKTDFAKIYFEYSEHELPQEILDAIFGE